jgi:hypothetical protein
VYDREASKVMFALLMAFPNPFVLSIFFSISLFTTPKKKKARRKRKKEGKQESKKSGCSGTTTDE